MSNIGERQTTLNIVMGLIYSSFIGFGILLKHYVFFDIAFAICLIFCLICAFFKIKGLYKDFKNILVIKFVFIAILAIIPMVFYYIVCKLAPKSDELVLIGNYMEITFATAMCVPYFIFSNIKEKYKDSRVSKRMNISRRLAIALIIFTYAISLFFMKRVTFYIFIGLVAVGFIVNQVYRNYLFNNRKVKIKWIIIDCVSIILCYVWYFGPSFLYEEYTVIGVNLTFNFAAFLISSVLILPTFTIDKYIKNYYKIEKSDFKKEEDN